MSDIRKLVADTSAPLEGEYQAPGEFKEKYASATDILSEIYRMDHIRFEGERHMESFLEAEFRRRGMC